MIKPVKRNKRLKWIDSHYARFHKPAFGITKAYCIRISQEMRDICNDLERKWLKEDVCNIESFNCVVKGSVTKCK